MKDKRILGKYLFFIPIVLFLFVFLLTILNYFEDALLFIQVNLAISLFFITPLCFGLGIYLMIRYRDKSKKFKDIFKIDKKEFFSKKVNIKSLLKGFLFLIVIPILFLILGFVVYDNVDSAFREKYYEPCTQYVLPQEEEGVRLAPTLLGSYEFVPDEYTWYWDETEQGYYYLDTLIDTPNLYIPLEIYTVKDSWRLKNNFMLDLNCSPIDVRKVEDGDTYNCSISYNGKVIATDVRHDVFCYYETSKNCTDNIGVILYSNRYSSGNAEYLFLISHAGESYNDLSVYRLENGEYFPLMFKYEDRGENISSRTFIVSDTKFELYGIEKYGMFDFIMDGDMELVTFFTEPTMGYNNNINGIHSIWRVEKDGLTLRKTVMELIEDWDSEVKEDI